MMKRGATQGHISTYSRHLTLLQKKGWIEKAYLAPKRYYKFGGVDRYQNRTLSYRVTPKYHKLLKQEECLRRSRANQLAKIQFSYENPDAKCINENIRKQHNSSLFGLSVKNNSCGAVFSFGGSFCTFGSESKEPPTEAAREADRRLFYYKLGKRVAREEKGVLWEEVCAEDTKLRRKQWGVKNPVAWALAKINGSREKNAKIVSRQLEIAKQQDEALAERVKARMDAATYYDEEEYFDEEEGECPDAYDPSQTRTYEWDAASLSFAKMRIREYIEFGQLEKLKEPEMVSALEEIARQEKVVAAKVEDEAWAKGAMSSVFAKFKFIQ